jgi:hypothetical protein
MLRSNPFDLLRRGESWGISPLDRDRPYPHGPPGFIGLDAVDPVEVDRREIREKREIREQVTHEITHAID